MLEILDTAGTVSHIKRERWMEGSFAVGGKKKNRPLMASPLCCCSAGAVHSYEGPVHEERARLCFGVLHYSTVDI